MPRLVALACEPLPARLVPAVYGWTACLLSALSLGYFLVRLGDGRARLMALAASLLALSNGEVYWTITNLQWLAQLYLVAACLLPVPEAARRPWREAVHALLVLVVALSGPFALLALGVLLGMAVLSRLPGPWRAPLATALAGLPRARLLALVLGATLQAVVMLAVRQPPRRLGLDQALADLHEVLLGHTLGPVPVGPLPVALVLVAMAALWLWQLGREPALAQARLLLGIVLAMGLAQALAGHI